jgi:putative transposase
VDAQRQVTHVSTGKQVGIDLGLPVFSTDSAGKTVANPRFLRHAERRLTRLQRQVSRTYDKTRKQDKRPQSQNDQKARRKLARAHRTVHRQREDVARRPASALVASHDVRADKDLRSAISCATTASPRALATRRGHASCCG